MPSISIVMPSLNQSAYLEDAIRSVLAQAQRSVELIVIDGGSTDGSLATIRRYESKLAYWTSERDDGPAHALNKGFARASGEILGFLNADDFLLPECLARVARAFDEHPEVDVISGHGYMATSSGDLAAPIFSDRWDFTRFLHGACILIQPATFFRRRIFERAGGLAAATRTAWDAQLWATMACAGATFHTVDVALAVHRIHAASISGDPRHRRQRSRDLGTIQRLIRGRSEIPTDRLFSFLYRFHKFSDHPARTFRQRWFFYSTLGRWTL